MRQWLVDGGLFDLVTLHPLGSGLIVLLLLFGLRVAVRGAARRGAAEGAGGARARERRRGVSDRL